MSDIVFCLDSLKALVLSASASASFTYSAPASITVDVTLSETVSYGFLVSMFVDTLYVNGVFSPEVLVR